MSFMIDVQAGVACYCNNQNWWWVQTRRSLIFDTFLWCARTTCPQSKQLYTFLNGNCTAVNNTHSMKFFFRLKTKHQIATFIAFINSSQKNFPRMFNISLIPLFAATGYLLGQRYSSSFSVNPSLLWLPAEMIHYSEAELTCKVCTTAPSAQLPIELDTFLVDCLKSRE